jgi:hypothetical protein
MFRNGGGEHFREIRYFITALTQCDMRYRFSSRDAKFYLLKRSLMIHKKLNDR